MFLLNPIIAILLMGGSGTRFGSELPKQFHRLAGKKVYLRTLETFLESQLFETIFLVCPKEWLEEVRNDLLSYSSEKIKMIVGGETRQESSLNGLLACPKDTKVVVIHDAVRPFVSLKILQDNVEQALQHKAIDTCIPSADTLVFAPKKEFISDIPKREHYLRGQTPQSFSYPLILQAHLKAKEDGLKQCSDDCTLVLRMGIPIHVVAGSEENIKITSELDLFLAEQVLRLQRTHSASSTTSLAGKRYVVAGGTGGIGQEICRLLKKEGAVPLVLSRSSSDYAIDLTSASSVQAVFQKICKEHGPLDGLINCMGLLKTKPFQELADLEVDQLLAANLHSVIYCCKHALLKSGGHIINIASSSYARGRKDYVIYSSAKAAIVNFTQGFAEERPDLFINAVVPQRTLTAMRLKNFPGEDPSTLLRPLDTAKEILSLLKQTTLTGAIVEVRKSV